MSDDTATKPVEEAQPQAVEQTEAPAAPTSEVTETGKAEEGEDEAKTEESNGNKNASVLKTKGQIDYDNYKNNRKFDPSTRQVTDDPAAIRKQVEFYFGDWNFPQDKFMWEQCDGLNNKPMPVKKIHEFKRMRVFQPYSAVIAALRDSEFLDIEGEEGQETIKRKVPYQPQSTGKAKTEAATVYVKGFGDETPDTQFELESFFAKFGEVKGLKLRRTNEDFFKGSVFVTFADEDEAKKFLALDPTPKWKEHDLKIMSKRDYCDEKNELIRQGKLEPNRTAPRKFYEGRDGAESRQDPDNWKKRREYDQRNGFRGGRGGRGRGRGGRGRGGRDFGGRDRRDRRDRDGEKKENGNAEAATESTSNVKRARDDDGGVAEEPATKKVDNKEVATES